MKSLDGLTFILLLLASYRLTRLIVFDEITSFIRRPFIKEQYVTDESGKLMSVMEEKGGWFHTFMGKLLSCYWCMGVWSSVFIVGVYLFVPEIVSIPFTLILAVAGAAGILESFVKG
ncbi:DUF1360 domain-containing protein [Paenibacillus marinisediminis]